MTIELRFHIERQDFALDVALSLPGEGVTAVFGPSGCGKTTLLRAFAGLDRHAGGHLRVGHEVWQDQARFTPPHRRAVGYVFQEPSLFPHLDVRGNIEYGQRRVPQSERRVSAEEAIELLGIRMLLERRPDQLSGGEQQRVAIARALASSPAVLLMDEPLAALDAGLKQEIMPYLESLHRELDIPVLYVSHARDEVARLADHVVLLEGGRVQAHGPLDQVFSRLDLSLAHDVNAETVIEAWVTQRHPEFGLSYLDCAAGRFALARDDLNIGARVRLRIAARDVSLTLERQSGTSILNVFPATVGELVDEGRAQTTVRLLIESVPVLARITRKSAVDLGLHPGQRVFAQIKSVSLG